MWTRLKTFTIWTRTRVVPYLRWRKNFRSSPIEKTEQLRPQITSTYCHQGKPRCIAKFFPIPGRNTLRNLDDFVIFLPSQTFSLPGNQERENAKGKRNAQDLPGEFKRIPVRCDDEMEDVSRSSIHAASLIYTFSFANKVVVQWYHIISAFSHWETSLRTLWPGQFCKHFKHYF